MSRWLLLLALLVVVACARSEEPVPATPPASPLAAAPPGAAAVATPVAAAPAPASAADAATENEDDEDEDDEDEDEDFDAPLGPEFEIDAGANQYFGYAPMPVVFEARALNGTPPFTFTWDFGDGSPPTTGETALHTYEKLGRVDASVVGKDATGETSKVQLILFVLSREEFARRRGIPVEQLPTPVVSPQG